MYNGAPTTPKRSIVQIGLSLDHFYGLVSGRTCGCEVRLSLEKLLRLIHLKSVQFWNTT